MVEIPEVLPILPLRDVVVFPYLIVPLSVGRPRSIETVQRAMAGDRLLLLVTQKDQVVEDPSPDDFFAVGTVCLIMRMLRQPDNRLRILVQGLTRTRVMEVLSVTPTITARVAAVTDEEILIPNATQEALMRTVHDQITKMSELGKSLNPDFLSALDTILEPIRLTYMVASNLELKASSAQSVLEEMDATEKLRRLVELLSKELEVIGIQAHIAESAQDHINQNQREYYLREQLKAIQNELGVSDSWGQEIARLTQQLKEAQVPPAALETTEKELKRLEHMNPESAEAQVVRTYVDWILSLPWDVRTADRINVRRAKEILDQDHYGLEEVKERICEFLAVRKLKPKSKGPILCFVGPPGVGKTSLGRSIARSMGRKFVRISLGGMRDEAEIRGHRRTYVGAMPGRIIQSLKQAGAANPVFMLDEIDKLGADFRGDPASALLEVLDPEQNDSFSDHYLNVPFDLSKVMFITTANLPDPIPQPLRDRMEVIELPGYTLEEKLRIAFRYLVPRQIEQNGLKAKQVTFTTKAVEAMIGGYTREAGLRNLERTIGKVCRKIARKVAEGAKGPVRVTQGSLSRYLGPVRFYGEEAHVDGRRVGIATGLAWTQAGGEILHVEASFVSGRGNLTLTGHLGDVMKESAQAALTYARSRASHFGIDDNFFALKDVHVHVPAGAIPKDGPSAGITMATTLVSAILDRPTRPNLAMTGEVTLRGNVLPVGGIKEKVLAAQRAGITEIILPEGNRRDLPTIPPTVRHLLKLHFVKTMDEVLALALENE